MTRSDGGLLAAAIDIGSNSIKMTIGRSDGHGGIEQLAWASEVVRLGEGVAATGRLDERRVVAAIEALRRFADHAREAGASAIVAVATEATRAAGNGPEFLSQVREATGIAVRLIDGDEEAALTLRGLAAELDLSGSALIADIGGGSTELVAVVAGAMAWSRSLALGSGRLTDELVQSDPPTAEELAACETEATRTVQEALQELGLPAGSAGRLVLVGGTPEYLVKLLPEGRPLDETAVRGVLTDLTTLTAAEVSDRIGVPEARARVLPAGGAIVAAIAALTEPEAIEVAHSGVRAGLLLETFQAVEDPDRAGGRPNGRGRQGGGKATKPERFTGRSGAMAKPDAGFRETMKALIAERWATVWGAIPVALAGEDIEGVHDVRVASRRLRAAMDIAAPVFPKPWYRTLHQAAKEITGALGEVRDRDVLLEALRAGRADAPLVEHPGIDRLIERVERERGTARAEMEAFLESLLRGPVRADVERRFGAGAGTAKAAKQTGETAT